ncbi:MAG: hypothetical protein AAF570_13745, partial [Bacteroidota bacterium]
MHSYVLRAGWSFLLFGLLFFAANSLHAQNSRPNSDTLTITAGDTLDLGHPYLVPYSELFTVEGKKLKKSQYDIDYIAGKLVVTDATLAGKKLAYHVRYFPEFLDRQFAFRTFRLKKDSVSGENIVEVEEYDQGGEQVFIIPSTVRKSGSISRGISVGNNQNLSVSSGLRLQLEGDLGDDLKLQAAITDETLPIQPDGTTQQINDFDKVFIQLLRKDDRIILGDFEINHRGTAFANFYRNVQGIGTFIKGKNFDVSVNGAVAKGKFQTNSF